MPGNPLSYYFKEVARDMANNPNNCQVFSNKEKKLPKARKNEFYIEKDVDFGIAKGKGQYRVVCLCRQVKAKTQVLKKYYSKTHYGTGSDAGKHPDFVEFQ